MNTRVVNFKLPPPSLAVSCTSTQPVLCFCGFVLIVLGLVEGLFAYQLLPQIAHEFQAFWKSFREEALEFEKLPGFPADILATKLLYWSWFPFWHYPWSLKYLTFKWRQESEWFKTGFISDPAQGWGSSECFAAKHIVLDCVYWFIKIGFICRFLDSVNHRYHEEVLGQWCS